MNVKSNIQAGQEKVLVVNPVKGSWTVYKFFPGTLKSGLAEKRMGNPGYAKGFENRYKAAKKHSINYLNRWKNKRGFEKKNDRFDAENR